MIAEDSPYYCDPYYEYCGGDISVPYDPYNYSKGSVHTMVWTSLWQAGIPFMLFNTLSEKAYEDSGLSTDPTTSRDHYTDEVIAWEEIMIANSAVWGPMFIFGVFSLSDLLTPVTSLYIEHMLSNMMIPAALFGAY